MKERSKGFLTLAFVALLIYLPCFLFESGMHNDYRFLPGNFADRVIFSEAEHLFVVGRALQAGLVNIQAWCIERISDFTINRFLAFLCMLWFAWLLERLLRDHLHVDAFWSRLIVLSSMTLPASQLYVIWTAHFLPGFVTLLLALGSYLLLDRMESWKKYGWGIGAAILFLASLYMYPMNAVFVFVCTFARLLFSPIKKVSQTLRIVFREIIFYAVGMIVYFISHLMLIIPRTASTVMARHDLGGTPYDFSISASLWGKVNLIIETFVVALAGGWHLFWGNAGAWINGAFVIVGLIILWGRKNKDVSNREIFLIVLAGIILFLLANSPTLMAKWCLNVIGYRVIFPATMMLVILQWGIWQKCSQSLMTRKSVNIIKATVSIWMAVSVLLGCVNVYDASRNNNRELRFIQREADDVNFQTMKKIMLITVTEGQNLIGRKMGFEFNYMINFPAMAQPIIDEVVKKKGVPPIPVIVDEGNFVFYDPNTYIIDVNQARLGSVKGTNKPIALVTTSAWPQRQVQVIRDRGIFFSFEETIKTKTLPFWLVSLNSPHASWLQLEFKNQGQEIHVFTFAVFAQTAPQKAWPMTCRLEASSDGVKWDHLETGVVMKSGVDENFRVYKILKPQSYSQYRFYFVNQGPNVPIPIQSIHMMLN